VKVQHEHEFEAAPGLPEALPPNEYVIWQGQPEWKQVAIDAFHVRKVVIYFALVIALQLLHLLEREPSLTVIAQQLATSVLLASLAAGLLTWCAYLTSTATMYTITNRRIVMRIGIVLTITLNLPLKKIVSCDLLNLNKKTGNIAICVLSGCPVGWFNLWPHVRAWRINNPQPTLRCIAQAERVGQLIFQAWRLECPSEQLVTQPAAELKSDSGRPLSHA
jgi:hypothetical protein